MESTDASMMPVEILQRMNHLEKSFTAEKENNNILQNKIEDIQNNYFNVAMRNDNLKHKENTHFLDHLYELECRLIKVEQYSRRESIEILGIADSIAYKDLEQTVLKIFSNIGATDIKSYDIATCHRLPKQSGYKYPTNVIGRLGCRKNISIIHQNKKNLFKCKNIFNT